MSYGPFKDQMNTHKRRYYTETEINTLPQQFIFGKDCMDLTKINRWRKCEGCDEGLLEVEPC